MALHLFLSNSLDTLAEKFAENFSMKGADPFEPLYAVVPNSGMGTFLKRHLARNGSMGIAANVECPFLQKFITDQMVKFFPPAEKESFRQSVNFWTPETLSWQIDHLLAKEKELFSEFTAYWGSDPVKRHLLGCELARCFDRYQFYRSSCTGKELLESWRSGSDTSDQAQLYRRLNELTPDPDSFYLKFFHAAAPLAPLPEKIGIFGIGTMSELHLLCLKKLSEYSEISLFCPSVCQVYYGDIRSRKEMLQEIKADPERAKELLDDAAANNQLLADLGVNGREFFNLLLDHGCFTGEETEELYLDPAEHSGDTLLHLFQSDILNARVRVAPPLPPGAEPPPPKDNTLRINCCPNARRELEMLHDQLLELFYSKSRQCGDGKSFKVTPELRMEDVIVMFPDINKAAPMIDAVFSAGPFKGKYAICDRSTAGQSQVIECFSRLLELPKGRCTSEEIVELLEFGCLNTKLRITPEELSEVVSQVFRARINWGLDSTEHLKFRNRGFEEFSWQDGIDRLLTEFARGEDASVIYAPCETGGIDGTSAGLFSIVAEFIATLKLWRTQLYTSRKPEEWNEFMQHWIQTFFAGGAKEYLPELAALRSAAGKVARGAAAADADAQVDPEVFISRLKSEYSLAGGKQHFLRDKITFCSLVPLRAIPAKVIAVLGLNDGEFPRMHHSNSFDQLKDLQRNDPNSANEGRFLFLEALMAAKEHLILSYVGMNDGQELAPAIPMVGVETVLEKGFHLRKNRVSLKPLELDSLKKCHQEEIKAAVTESLPPAPAPLPEEMSLYTLAELLTRNCKSFFKYRYGFEYSAKEKTALVSDDPETLSPLDNSLLLKALWALRLDENIPETEWIKYVEKARFLPVNGQELFDNAAGIIANVDEKIVSRFRNQTAIECKVPLEIPVLKPSETNHKITLHGTIRLTGDRKSPDSFCRTELLTSSSTPEKKLKFYLEQLLLAAFLPGKKVSGILYPLTEKNFFLLPAAGGNGSSTANAAEKLRQLVTIALRTFYDDVPQPIFTYASGAWAETLLEKGVTDSRKSNPEDASLETDLDIAVKQAESKARTAFEKDLKYNDVISIFYDRGNFMDNFFPLFAETIYLPVAAMETLPVSKLAEIISGMEENSK